MMLKDTKGVLSQILDQKIVAIIRGAKADTVLDIAEALHEGGVNILEVTFNSPNAIEAVQELAIKMGDKMLIGMGTVLNGATATAAVDAGARFIISPTLNLETIRETKRSGAVSIPGAFTPTEIVTAFNAGADIIKVFPASGNVNYIKDVRACLSNIPLMPTGGISLENVNDFQKAGAVAFGIGTALVNTREAVTDEFLKRLTEKARQFIKAVN